MQSLILFFLCPLRGESYKLFSREKHDISTDGYFLVQM